MGGNDENAFQIISPIMGKTKAQLALRLVYLGLLGRSDFFHHCPEYSDDMVEWPTRPEDEPTSEDPKQVKRRRLVPMSTHEDEDEDLLLNSEEEEEQELQL